MKLQVDEVSDSKVLGIMKRTFVDSIHEAMRLVWLCARGAALAWEPDEEGHGFVFTKDGRVIAHLYKVE